MHNIRQQHKNYDLKYHQRHENNNNDEIFDIEDGRINFVNSQPMQMVDQEDDDFGGVWHVPINEENILIN